MIDVPSGAALRSSSCAPSALVYQSIAAATPLTADLRRDRVEVFRDGCGCHPTRPFAWTWREQVAMAGGVDQIGEPFAPRVWRRPGPSRVSR